MTFNPETIFTLQLPDGGQTRSDPSCSLINGETPLRSRDEDIRLANRTCDASGATGVLDLNARSFVGSPLLKRSWNIW